ncbi:hypothetical protein A2U01_0060460, partial [Trifolium medium]|nr:hypothetical protein [Trifolium medium]
SKKIKTTIIVADDEEEPEIPLRRKKTKTNMGTHATEESNQAGGSQVEHKQDRKRKDKKKS